MEKVKKIFKSKLIDRLLTVLLVIMSIYFLLTKMWGVSIIGQANVSGPSMNPTFANKDTVWYNKHPKNLKYKDVVAVHMKKKFDNRSYDEDIIKRVICTPKQECEVKSGKLYVNKKFVKQDFKYVKMNFSKDFGTLKKDEYVVLGDNRPVSLDSRYVGKFNIKDIFGRIYNRNGWFFTQKNFK